MAAQARRKWDLLLIAGVLLCLGPELATSIHLGLPDDLAMWEWFVILPISIAILGLPQIMILVCIYLADALALRAVYLALSAALIAVYVWFLTTADLMSSSTAVVGLYFFSFYLALGAIVLGALVAWVYERL